MKAHHSQVVSIEPKAEGYDVVLWDQEANNPVTVGHYDYATDAATHAIAVCDAILSWLQADRKVTA